MLTQKYRVDRYAPEKESLKPPSYEVGYHVSAVHNIARSYSEARFYHVSPDVPRDIVSDPPPYPNLGDYTPMTR